MQDSIAFMISDVSRLMRRRFDERARAIGVTRTQWRVLKFLQRGEGINQGGLAEMLGSALAGVSDAEQALVIATLQQIRANLSDAQPAKDAANA